MGYLFENGALDAYDRTSPMEPAYGQFQQEPQQLMTDQFTGQMQSPQDSQMVDPQRMAYGAALMNIGNIIGGRAPNVDISSAYMRGKSYNDNLRQNKAAVARQTMQDERQAEQDKLAKQLQEARIGKLNAEAAAKSGGGFQGTGMEAQALNAFLNQFPLEQRGAIRDDLVRQRLSRDVTTVTPEGTFVSPGYDVGGYAQQPPPQPTGQTAPPAIDVPPAFTAKPLTGEQAKASGFYERMISSQGEIDRVLSASPDFDPAATGESVAGSVPLIGNMLISPDKQQYNQAAKDWIRAKLRRESGAVIGEEEAAEEYRTYFPMPGDSKEVIAQKGRARKTAESAMQSATGRSSKDDDKPKRRRYNPETGKIE